MSLPPEVEREPTDEPYDPELLFLRSLEREIRNRAVHHARERARAQTRAGRTAAVHAERTTQAANRGHQRTRALSPFGARVARRTLMLVVLLCLIGASAFGADHALSGEAEDPTEVRQGAFVPVAAGRMGGERWSLRLYMRGGELCRVLSAGETASSRCSAPPRGAELGITSVVNSSRRYFYGVSGPAVARVTVHAGEAFANVPTHVLTQQNAGAERLPKGARWFVTTLLRPVDEPDPPAQVQALDARGHQLGPSLTDCAEAPEALPCPR
jgi:hypothetical protein